MDSALNCGGFNALRPLFGLRAWRFAGQGDLFPGAGMGRCATSRRSTEPVQGIEPSVEMAL